MRCPISIWVLFPFISLAVEKKEQGLKLSNTSILGIKKKIQNLIKQSEKKDSKNQESVKNLKGKVENF